MTTFAPFLHRSTCRRKRGNSRLYSTTLAHLRHHEGVVAAKLAVPTHDGRRGKKGKTTAWANLPPAARRGRSRRRKNSWYLFSTCLSSAYNLIIFLLSGFLSSPFESPTEEQEFIFSSASPPFIAANFSFPYRPPHKF